MSPDRHTGQDLAYCDFLPSNCGSFWQSFLLTTRILISCVYPIVGSFQALEKLQEAKVAFEKANLNIAGINVPLSTFLKTPADAKAIPELSEAQIVVYRSNQVQKWLVYWIVLLAAHIASRILLLAYWVPFYSLLKLLVSIWLVSPLFLPTGFELHDAARDLQTFYTLGCGYCYAQVIRPWLKGRLDALAEFSMDSNVYETASKVLNAVGGYLKTVSASFTNGSQSGQLPAADYRSMLVTKLGGWGFFAQPLAETSEQVEEEFDVIESPGATETSAAEVHSTNATKKGWFW